MGIKEILDFSDKRTKKYLTMTLYTAIILLIAYFLFRKRLAPPQNPQVPKATKKEDVRPRLSISGTLVTPESLSTLSKIGRFTRLYLMFKVANNEEEDKIKNILIQVPSLTPHRVLFCETDIGYKALLRQLNPTLHIEKSLQYANEMAAYINAIAIVSDQECEQFYQIIEFQDCESMIVNILNDLH